MGHGCWDWRLSWLWLCVKLSSGTWRTAVWYRCTDVSTDAIDFLFRKFYLEDEGSRLLTHVGKFLADCRVRHKSVNTPSSHERLVVRTWLAVYRPTLQTAPACLGHPLLNDAGAAICRGATCSRATPSALIAGWFLLRIPHDGNCV
jgi:hypothetical protein